MFRIVAPPTGAFNRKKILTNSLKTIIDAPDNEIELLADTIEKTWKADCPKATHQTAKNLISAYMLDYSPISWLKADNFLIDRLYQKYELPEASDEILYTIPCDIIEPVKDYLDNKIQAEQCITSISAYLNITAPVMMFKTRKSFEEFQEYINRRIAMMPLKPETRRLLRQFTELKMDSGFKCVKLRPTQHMRLAENTFARILTNLLEDYSVNSATVTQDECIMVGASIKSRIVPLAIVFACAENIKIEDAETLNNDITMMKDFLDWLDEQNEAAESQSQNGNQSQGGSKSKKSKAKNGPGNEDESKENGSGNKKNKPEDNTPSESDDGAEDQPFDMLETAESESKKDERIKDAIDKIMNNQTGSGSGGGDPTRRINPNSTKALTQKLKKKIKRIIQSTSARTMNERKTIIKTFMRESRRDPMNIDLMGRHYRTTYTKDLHLYIDVSGSINLSMVEFALNAAADIATELKLNLFVTPFDGELYEKQTIVIPGSVISKKSALKKLKQLPISGGGTEFDEVYKYIESSKKRKNEISIMITDYCDSPSLPSPKTLYYMGCKGTENYSIENFIRHMERTSNQNIRSKIIR
jgi:putative uncharacterized protein cgl1759